MSKPKSAVTKATESIREEAQALDTRRQHQIANQVEIINRLLGGDETFEDIQVDLVGRLAEAQARVQELEAENARLQAELKGDG